MYNIEKMIKKFTILGERCSGTNFLEKSILSNFDIELTWEYGYKHFFGYHDYKNNDGTLFIGIVRDPFKWMNSLYRLPHHLQEKLKINPNTFLQEEFWSYYDVKEIHGTDFGSEIMVDRNIYTGERYKNIFECREIKCKFLLDDMKKKVKNFILIRYEDLRDNYAQTLQLIKNKFSLEPKNEEYEKISINLTHGGDFCIDKTEILDRNTIINNLNKNIEIKLGYM
jgi:hypothetical protein